MEEDPELRNTGDANTVDNMPLNLSELRKKINQSFDDVELKRLCMENFPTVYEKFSEAMRKDEKINLLVDHCRRNAQEAEQLQYLLTDKQDKRTSQTAALGIADNSSGTNHHQVIAPQDTIEPPIQNDLKIRIFSSNQSMQEYVCKFIDLYNVKEAKILHYSGEYVSQVIEKLLQKKAAVKLLLGHPGAVPKTSMWRIVLRSWERFVPNKRQGIDTRSGSHDLRGFQNNKMMTFHQKMETDFINGENLDIKYYMEPASIRGIKLDDRFLSIGWYTYRPKVSNGNVPWLYGHNNATVNVVLDQPEALKLAATFDDQFDALWNEALLRKNRSDKTNPFF